MSFKEKKILRNALEEICCNECKNTWCLLKEIIYSSHDDHYARFLKQIKCIEILKLVESEKAKQDIGWEETWLIWIEQGFAKKFADLYNENKDAIQLYYEVIKK